jgi:hypothetical protein
MRVLVAISILAFLALLWACVAIFQHIRRTQRRRRRALEASRNDLTPTVPAALITPTPAAPVIPEITFHDPEAPLPEIAFTDSQAPIREPSPQAFQPYLRRSEFHRPAASPVPLVAHTLQPEIVPAEEFVDTLPPPPNPEPPRDAAFSPVPAWPHFGFTPARPAQPFRAPIIPTAEPELTLAAEQAMEDHQVSGRMPDPPAEPIPYAAPAESSASVTPARLPLVIHPPAPAVKPIYPSAHPTLAESTPPPPPPLPPRSGKHPVVRADWAYFNKDMGDLSDPAPAGSRTRVRINNSE